MRLTQRREKSFSLLTPFKSERNIYKHFTRREIFGKQYSVSTDSHYSERTTVFEQMKFLNQILLIYLLEATLLVYW